MGRHNFRPYIGGLAGNLKDVVDHIGLLDPRRSNLESSAVVLKFPQLSNLAFHQAA